MHSWYYEIRVCEWGGVEWEKIIALWSILGGWVRVHRQTCSDAIFAIFARFFIFFKYKRTKIHVERSVVDNVVLSHYVPKLNERLVQYSSTIVPIFIVSALVDASFSYKDTWNYLYFMGISISVKYIFSNEWVQACSGCQVILRPDLMFLEWFQQFLFRTTCKSFFFQTAEIDFSNRRVLWRSLSPNGFGEISLRDFDWYLG